MDDPKTITPRAARRKLQDDDLLLVCAYDDDGKFQRNELEGAIPLSRFRAELPDLPKSHEIAFY